MTSQLNRIALLGTYVPRQCGIGTFTNDLHHSLVDAFPGLDCRVIGMTDHDRSYTYPPEVRFELHDQRIESYRRAADFLNINNFDLVSVQHEFGIFGGAAGSHLLTFLKELRMPVVTTVHSVLKEPKELYRRVFNEVLELSDRVVTMADRGRQFLTDVYGVPESKIDLIPHGIPDVPFYDPNFYKDEFGVAGNTVLLTFGLLGPNKGIEYVIEALPMVLERFPNLVYIVLGATHPYWLKKEGEAYRLSLERLAEKKGIKKHVIFFNDFVSQKELMEFVGAADLYVTPYLDRDQITSGTLSYAVGAGKSVLSTPYYHAEELLADGRGILMPFRDSEALGKVLIEILGDDPRRHAMRKRAYHWSREMVWSKVAEAYVHSFEKAKEMTRIRGRPKAFALKTLEERPYPLPPLRLQHLRTLTDSTGILHDAIHNIPNFAGGYRTDDNARAFVLATLLEDLGEETALLDEKQAASTYLSLIHYAFDSQTGRFRSWLRYDRAWAADEPSDDTHGRVIWTLGTAIGRSENTAYRSVGGQLFSWSLSALYDLKSLRGWAHSLVGIYEYLHHFEGDRAAMEAAHFLTQRLLQSYEENASEDWPWFEAKLSYENARLPHALIVAGRVTQRSECLEVGLKTLRWLIAQETNPAGWFSPIGGQQEYWRGGQKPRYSQRPNDAYVMISACLEAYRVTRESNWLEFAQLTFDWFLGRNELNESLYDSRTGGCRDELLADRVSPNLGAEATLAFNLALVELRYAQEQMGTAQTPKVKP